MLINTEVVLQKAKEVHSLCKTGNAYMIADMLGIHVMPRPFVHQKGVYKVILGQRFIFMKDDLDDVMKNMVLLHEIGHDQLHREEAGLNGGFQEFNIFNMRGISMEYEANLFAAQVSLPDEEILELLEEGYDIQYIAKTMNSDINLVVLKIDMLIRQGYKLRKVEHRNDFLRY